MHTPKFILVTGANKGIGYAITKKVLQHDPASTVFLGSRSATRGQEAKKTLVKEESSWEKRIIVTQLDVTEEASVAQAQKQIQDTIGQKKLYGIVNNAGIAMGPLQQILDVNVYGVHNVCSKFIPLLHPTDGRIVVISSAAGPSFVSRCSSQRKAFLIDPNVEWTDIDTFMKECLNITGGAKEFASRGLGNGSSYHLSKACVNAYTLHLARTYPQIKTNACTPGFIETDLTRPMAKFSGKTPQEMGMLPAEKGTISAMHLLFDSLEGNGRYYGSDAIRSPLDKYRSPGDPPYTGE